jgi:hypothetical protein
MTLKDRALQVKNETQVSANTATRVGGLLEDMNDQFDTAYANYFDFSSDAVTNITTVGQWVKLNTTTTEGFKRNGLTHSNNRVTRTGSKRVFQMEGIVSLGAGNNQEIHVAFFKNEALFPCSEQSVVTSAAGRRNGVPFQCLIELEENDFVEVYVKNQTATNNITLGNLNVIIKQL